jgi:S1-C subfamily serine protease
MAADEHAIGSGVIVDSDGYIMRNTHVDEGAQSIQVAQEFRSSASGLQTGDIIHSVNQTSVDSLTSLRAAINGIKPHDSVVLQIERGGGFQWLAFEME